MPMAKKVNLAKARTQDETLELLNDFIDQELRTIKLNETLESLTEQVRKLTGGARAYHRKDRLRTFCEKHNIRLGEFLAAFDNMKTDEQELPY